MTSWRDLSVPRDDFVPPVVWVDDPRSGGFVSLSKEDGNQRWRTLVESDEPIVTQVDDGHTRPGGIGLQPSSSCSQPSLVAEMLDALDVRAGQRVLEIGTGTGWNAALLSDMVGPDGEVVSVEVDDSVAEAARDALHAAGYDPLVVTADGTLGYEPEAPYDRVIATTSVRAIPPAWLKQTRPGGVIVCPWGTDYCNGGLLRLHVHHDGSASGRVGTNLAFMRVRNQRRGYLEPDGHEQEAADRSVTRREPREFFDMISFSRAAFTIGLRVPWCYHTLEEIDNEHRVFELHDVRSASWARVDLMRGTDAFEVRQRGPRQLWDEADGAYSWWIQAGRVRPARFGLTVTPDGTHSVWLDTPEGRQGWALSL